VRAWIASWPMKPMICSRSRSSRTYSSESVSSLANQRSATGKKRFSVVAACEPYGSPGIQCRGVFSQLNRASLGRSATSSGANSSIGLVLTSRC
jgi:hypothetical protein